MVCNAEKLNLLKTLDKETFKANETTRTETTSKKVRKLCFLRASFIDITNMVEVKSNHVLGRPLVALLLNLNGLNGASPFTHFLYKHPHFRIKPCVAKG